MNNSTFLNANLIWSRRCLTGKKLTLHSSSLIGRQKIEFQEKVERDVSGQKRQITGKNLRLKSFRDYLGHEEHVQFVVKKSQLKRKKYFGKFNLSLVKFVLYFQISGSIIILCMLLESRHETVEIRKLELAMQLLSSILAICLVHSTYKNDTETFCYSKHLKKYLEPDI